MGCRSDDDCSGQHSCVNRNCVPVCAVDGSSCGTGATCYGAAHRANCECPPGFVGNPNVACIVLGCRSNSDCPGEKACVSEKCVNPCEVGNLCAVPAECTVYRHKVQCTCPPGFVADAGTGCEKSTFHVVHLCFNLMFQHHWIIGYYTTFSFLYTRCKLIFSHNHIE